MIKLRNKKAELWELRSADTRRKDFIDFLGQILRPETVIVREQEDETYKLLVMHQDRLFIRVHVELDDITFTITVE